MSAPRPPFGASSGADRQNNDDFRLIAGDDFGQVPYAGPAYVVGEVGGALAERELRGMAPTTYKSELR